MIRVLHIIDSVRGGGKERQFVELLKGLVSRKDIVSDVILMSDIVDYTEFRRFGISTHLLARHNRYDFGIFRRLRKLVRELEPDVVHSWNPMCTFYGAPVAWLAGVKFIDGSVRAAPPNLTWRNLDFFIRKLTTPFADLVIGNSLAGLRAYDVPPKKSICVYNGFDPARISQLANPTEIKHQLDITTPNIVGMVASFSVFKDYDTFFAIGRQITTARDDVTFVAIGDGEHFDAYRNQFPERRFPRIKMLGWRPDVEDVVQTFTVGVLFSPSEGLPNAIMEYMALAKPVVASSGGGTPELVIEGKTGYLVADGDVSAAIDRIQELLDDEELALSLGKNGQRVIREDFTIEKMVSVYIRLYEGLAHG